jgi:Protein of unknown function (DUF4197)
MICCSVLFLVCLSGAVAPAQDQSAQLTKVLGLGKSNKLGDDKIIAGLKEALRVGTDNTVKSTGKVDGYFGDAAIKILMPEKLRTIEKGLRVLGEGPRVDEFILSMNRAAEKAAPLAKDIFVKAILEMSFEDAGKILGGGDTAATEYFKAKTSDKLGAAFKPIVEKSMSEVGVTKQYEQLMGQAKSIPFLNSQSLDINHYVVTKALDGLFYVLGQEERKIRTNPAARVTDLLKQVFGSGKVAGSSRP